MNEAIHHKEAGTMTGNNENYGMLPPQHLHLHQTMGLRVMEVQCQLPPQYPQGPRDQGVSTMANTARSLEAK